MGDKVRQNLLRRLTHKEVLHTLDGGLLVCLLTVFLGCGSGPGGVIEPGGPDQGMDEQLLEQIERPTFEFFRQEATAQMPHEHGMNTGACIAKQRAPAESALPY